MTTAVSRTQEAGAFAESCHYGQEDIFQSSHPSLFGTDSAPESIGLAVIRDDHRVQLVQPDLDPMLYVSQSGSIPVGTTHCEERNFVGIGVFAFQVISSVIGLSRLR
ncbi:uncharacterized protein ATNIH1004_004091 [Aspergillus tanneri]|uniref:Uncharacterized protein n=1 Tax=Aspergillus tanneri TaxID=1220188 RepID=A0A5M9MMG2_9EURO|nr:uncharacterized protein ATNIH1004_004091 [Aspergillus tanneri]KAA8648208.1 hypothetical protein ATNIH1004_004091 [Aspergillus tanneri]